MLSSLLVQILLGIDFLSILIVWAIEQSSSKARRAEEDSEKKGTAGPKPSRTLLVAEGLAQFFILFLILNILLYSTVRPYLLPIDLAGLSDVTQITGFCISMMGAGVMLGGFWTLGRSWTYSKDARRGIYLSADHQLVQTGIYGRIRHPIYLGTLFLYGGCAILPLEGIMLLIFLIIVIWVYLQAVFEEETLHEHFGKKYERYMLQTGRFLPRRKRTR
jgi:protein-S-isoprenylcysteine O-methyltransferase Ste14